MAKSSHSSLQQNDATAVTLQPSILFDCGDTGNVLAAKGIEFKRLKLSVEQGKIIRAKSKEVKIKVTQIGTNPDHVTILGLTADKTPDEMHIRVPIGVRFFKVAVPKEKKDQGIDSAFFFQASDGYNVLPHVIPLGKDPNQKVQELVLICSHVPPRRGPIPDDETEDITA
jgi:hypothetical protein